MAKQIKKAEQLREQIRADLLDQLERNGTVGKFYIDLVDDYLRLWDVKRGLSDDIAERGPKVKVFTSTTENIKTNDSVPDLLRVNGQMLRIIECLGIKPAQTDTEEDEL